eukprot:CAMPEP_0169222120 /NCGR_PEP_ID=MMETSP1016-20121227/21419_1 /TAXON_ID=342587 /ORGANISM="Karlodinium micrum, Strain CCMP2283" /LENGTH=104 /DNA_ID=CAMNT_0009300387 /DNA_START=285 /DNA_END=596 /DNA_ORIENTATION=+
MRATDAWPLVFVAICAWESTVKFGEVDSVIPAPAALLEKDHGSGLDERSSASRFEEKATTQVSSGQQVSATSKQHDGNQAQETLNLNKNESPSVTPWFAHRTPR